MRIVWGIVVVVLSLVAWGGQFVSWLAPRTAQKLSLTEAEDSVEPVYFADIRGEAPLDAITLWTMVVAGVLLILNVDAWAYFGLVGGGMYVYFAGRGLFTRVAIQRHGFKVGEERNVRIAYTMLAVWAAMGLITIAAAVIALQAS